MLFWTRAFLCIGTVTVMAIGRLPSVPVSSPATRLAEPTTTLASDACRVRADLCATLLTGGLRALVLPPASSATKPRAPRRADAPVALRRRSLT